MTEEQELLAKIGQLAGQINQHKNQSRNAVPSTNYHTRHPRSGWAPYRGRGGTRRPTPHRNRTLILNNSNNNTADASKTPPSKTPDSATPPPASSSGWVAKRDRHMQLINSSIYDREVQARTKAIAETEKARRERKTKAEEAKVMRYAQGIRNSHNTSVPGQISVTSQPPSSYQIYIHNTPFQVVRGGSKLIRQSNDPKNANATPKKVVVGGVTFVRSKKGNLHRLGAVVAKRKPSKIKKKNELCKRFSRTGSCYKGPDCAYIHDANKVAICKDFLQTGKCPSGDSCDLSHEPSPHRSPVCVHFLRGRCSNPQCRYAHVRVTPGAPVCRSFAIIGYCERGAECPDRHVYECPDYANTGTCNKKKCALPHVDRAGQLRKATTAKSEAAPPTDGDEEDVSSEEEEYDEIDSDDVDSDELDSEGDEPMVEFVEGGTDDTELSGQRDFVHF